MPRKVNVAEPEPFSEEEHVIIRLAQESFPFFLHEVYPQSFVSGGKPEQFLMADGSWRPFSLGKIHYTWARLLELYNRICILAPRLHLKSTVVHQGYAFWQLFRANKDVSGASISYKEDLAAGQTEHLKYAILKNSFCRFWVDRKPTSDTIVDFKVSFGPKDEPWRGNVDPYGVLGNMRSLHPDFVVADDILSDLANPLDPKQVVHIDNIFNQVIGSLPRNQGPIVVIGTPQSYEDTLFRLRNNPQYVWARFPAETIDPVTGCTSYLWPEVFDKRMLDIKLADIKQRAYDVEYLLTPIQSTDAFFPEWVIDAIVDPYLTPADPTRPWTFPASVAGVYGGMDIGKEVHPTHISIGALLKSGDLIQIYEQFLDGMTYDRQAAVINMLVRNFNVKRFYYDATRGEMDDRNLSAKAKGIKFTIPQRGQMALSLEARVFANPGQPGLILLHDERQKRQLLSVSRAFKAVETSDGHSDAAFSIALMCRAADDGPVFTHLGDLGSIFGAQARAGQLARLGR